jgi:septal ring factor EnvC (AmiA/AmiB activator)
LAFSEAAMAENVENIVLEVLKSIQTDCAYFRRKFDDIDLRLAALESHAAANHLDSVQLSARINSIDKRLDRIERRLELRDEAVEP